jgi:DNA ligase 1
MQAVSELILAVGKASGRNAKIALLKRHAEAPGFKEILQFIYNPYIKTGIAKKKLDKGVSLPADVADITVIEWDTVIEYFTKHQTGNQGAVNFAKHFVDQFEKGSAAHTVAIAMVTKTLKIGVTEKTLNQVYGEAFIPMIGIMKAEKYDEFKNKVKGPFIATEKLDGARRILVKEDGVITMYSRSGIPDDGLVDIEREAEALPNNCVYDGELLAIGDFDNAIELRQASNSLANRKGKRTGLTFNVFDMVPITDFKQGVSKHDALTRKLMLGAMFNDESIECLAPTTFRTLIQQFKRDYDFKYIKSVPIEGIANSDDDVRMLAEPIWRRGFEGIMLNTFTGKYDITKDRSRDILKVKNVVEMVLTVVGVEEGKAGTKNEGKLGALILDYNGNEVGCGSGLDDANRNKWWVNPSLIIGKKVEIDCFGESHNKQGGVSLNCPIFKRVVGHE